MGKLILSLIVILVGIQIAYAKSFGNYLSYKQITDKEILFVTTNGHRILVTANQDYVLGIKALGEHEEIKLCTPNELKKMNFSGSLYVEELDDQIEISSASFSDIKIRVNKAPFRFTYLNSKSNQVVVDEFRCPQFDKNSCNISFLLGLNEQIEIYTGNKQSAVSNFKNLYPSQISRFGNEPVMVISSNGYGVLLESTNEKQFKKTKRNQLDIQVMCDSESLQYYFVFGDNRDDILARITQFNEKFDYLQFTQR